jgi:plastocyanin domain-containing protein
VFVGVWNFPRHPINQKEAQNKNKEISLKSVTFLYLFIEKRIKLQGSLEVFVSFDKRNFSPFCKERIKF